MDSKGTCSVSGCGRPVNGRGWCQKHYMRWYYRGMPGLAPDEPIPHRSCAIPGCGGNAGKSGLCRSHAIRQVKNGDPLIALSQQPCAIPDCDGLRASSHGWCSIHERRWKRHGDPLAPVRRRYPPHAVCYVGGCGGKPRVNGMCTDHYNIWKTSGDPTQRSRRPRGEGTYSGGYHIVGTGNGVQRPAHRVLMEQTLGRMLGRHEVVHHINGDKLDNRMDNLIVLTRAEHAHLHHAVRAAGLTLEEALRDVLRRRTDQTNRAPSVP